MMYYPPVPQPRPILDTLCPICNVSFSPWERHLIGRDMRTCSDKCSRFDCLPFDGGSEHG